MSTGTWVRVLEYEYEYYNSIVVKYFLWVRVLEYEYEYYNSVVVKYFLWVRVLEYSYLSTSMNTPTL